LASCQATFTSVTSLTLTFCEQPLQPTQGRPGKFILNVSGPVRQIDDVGPKEEEYEKMNRKIIIRDEIPKDASAITDVTIAAFKTLAISQHTEQFIVEELRAAKALALSLVAEIDGLVIGHIALSPVTISDGTPHWYGLGPVSVLPEYQRRGIGKKLIEDGLSRLKDTNARGCCLVGHPEYYGKFGFKNISGLMHEGVPPEVFFAMSFDGHIPTGTVTFHEAFKADGQEGGAASG